MDTDVFRIHAEVETRHWWFVARREILRAVVEEAVRPHADRIVVDLGCGVGATAPAFHPAYTYIGWEPSAVAVDFAREQHPDVAFHVGTAADAAADLARADIVLLNDVMEHVQGDVELLRQIVEPMAPGSWLLITVPAGMELWSPHDVALCHFRRYDLNTLQNTWSDLPVHPVMLSYYNTRLYAPVRAVRWITSYRDQAAGGEGTDFSLPPAPLNHALRRIFAGEAHRLTALIRGRVRPYRRGVSLIALLQRVAGSPENS